MADWVRTHRTPLGAALLLAAAAGLGVIAYWQMFSTFDVPDDVGYALMSLRKFFDGGAPYDQVYSQWGPGLFVLVGGFLKIFGIGLGDETALYWNFFVWLLASLFIGLALLKQTGRLLVAGIGLVLSFLILAVAVNEPLHPGATIALLLSGILLAAAFLLPGRSRAAMAAIGILGAALLSLKVNVGLFALISVAFAAVSTLTVLRRYPILRVLVTLAFVVLPFPLMAENIGDGWGLRYAIFVAAGALGLAMISLRLSPSEKPDLGGVKAFVLGVVGAIALVSIVPILVGTSPGGLIDGWVIRPAGSAKLAHAEVITRGESVLWAVFGVGLAALATWAWRRGLPAAPRVPLAIGRLLVGLLIWICLAGPVFHIPIDLTQGLVVGAPLLWVAAIPVAGGKRPQDSFQRMLVPALASLQFLHAYPMPGSQLLWSVFLLVPVAGICVADALDEFAAAEPAWDAGKWALRVVPVLAVVAFGVWLCLKPLRKFERDAHARYETTIALKLPGAEHMRVTPPLAYQLRNLTAGIRENCDQLLTLPGMNSLNFLSETEAPVELSSPWPYFFSVSEQQEIVDRARRTPGLCVVWKPDLVAFWGQYYGGEPPQRPLIEYMERDFHQIHNYNGYILMLPNQPA